MLDLAGQTLGKYRLQERIGKGGMSVVYRAFQPGLERSVAVKALLPHLSDSDEFVRRFRREAQAVADLRHPNIVQVFDFDQDAASGTYYMVMEHIQGETLKARLARLNRAGRRLPPLEVVDFFEGLLAGVGYAHSRGMFHRDLKPANIMFDRAGRTVLTDFGIAHILGGERFTLTGVVMGTPVYMSPEQGEGQSGDTRSDLYSLGIVLFESLTGQVPYDADTPFAVMHKHLNQPIPSLRQVLPEAAALDSVIEQALAKSPSERYQTAEAMWQGLSQARQRLGNPAGALFEIAPRPARNAATLKPAITPALSSGRATAPARGGAGLRRINPNYGWAVAAAALALALGGLLYYRGAPARLGAGIEQGQAQLAAHDYPAALTTFDQIIAGDPRLAPARLGRAEALLGLGRPDEALLEVQAAAEHAPNDPAVLVARGRYRLLYTSGPDVTAALYDFDTAIAIQPGYAPAYLARGWAILNFQDDAPAALADLREAVRLAPEEPEAHRTLAAALSQSGDNQAALREIEAALGLQGDDPEYYLESALIRGAVSDWVGAGRDLDAALSLAPDNVGYIIARAYLNAETARFDQALAGLEQALRLRPGDAAALYTRGLIYLKQGDPARALADLDEVAAREPFEYQSPFLSLNYLHEVNLDRAFALQALPGRETEALAALDLAAEAEPDWFAVYFFRGKFLAQQGQTGPARADLALAAQLAPSADWQERAQTELKALDQ